MSPGGSPRTRSGEDVTDGNARAERLYRSMGFIPRFTGVAWYATGSVPISPEQD
ncbi:MAG TPA: hypothetical protein VMV28_06470 [Thermoplasmata archaeon]|nr:hypothetical protein [Thermoplasmata archaeon]